MSLYNATTERAVDFYVTEIYEAVEELMGHELSIKNARYVCKHAEKAVRKAYAKSEDEMAMRECVQRWVSCFHRKFAIERLNRQAGLDAAAYARYAFFGK